MGSIPTRSRHSRARSGALLLLLVLSLPGAALSQTDSTSVGRGKGWNAPFAVMLRSILVPGWGQAKNGQWVKAALFAGAEGALLYGIAWEDHLQSEADRNARERPDEAFYWRDEADRHGDRKRSYLWWTAFAVLLGAGDAYVDAHLHGFDAEFREEDSAVLLSFEVLP